ncbi:MAG TPA: NAD-dependent epimerase/dehydratase family protein [Flavobacteriales bacterium]|nr:NAD-dependent epimerase/dehydratase family protein [Flavobacteriales bacterium]
MKILITGAAGYVGTELSYLLAAHVDVEKLILYDNLSRSNYNAFIGVAKYFPNKVEFIEGDILDTRKLKKIVSNVDAVIHLAAKVSTPFSDDNPHLFEQVNHWGTAEMTYAIEACPNVKKFIYASSVSVYGSGPHTFTVHSELNPRTFYGISKMRGEEHASRIQDKTNTWIMRLGNVYGYSKSMRFDAVINKFMFDANFKNKITIHGDGNQYRSFVHIHYVTKTLAQVVTGNEVPTGTYNIINENLTVNEITDSLRTIFPDLEMLFVNQHMKLRGLQVEPDVRIEKLAIDRKPLPELLTDFKKEFTF